MYHSTGFPRYSRKIRSVILTNQPLFSDSDFNVYNIKLRMKTTTCYQRPLFWGPEGGHCAQDCIEITI